MIAKASTKTFSDKPNSSTLRGDGIQSMSPKDREKLLGESNLGDYLNKVSDPNWVDPAKKIRAVGNNDLGKDAFMKLMLEQMKNQDPTDPVKSHEMAAQLAQFSSLEQLMNVNQNLEGLRQSQSPAGNFQSLNFIGKIVSGDASRIIRSSSDKEHAIHFNLLGEADTVNVEISDLNGNVVKKMTVKNPKKGENEISWDGIAENGQSTRSGEYRVKIQAQNNSGKTIGVETKFEGRVSGVNFTAEGPVLLVGNKSVRLSEVKKIVDETSLETKKEENKNRTKENEAKPANGVLAMEGHKPLPLAQEKVKEVKRGLPL